MGPRVEFYLKKLGHEPHESMCLIGTGLYQQIYCCCDFSLLRTPILWVRISWLPLLFTFFFSGTFFTWIICTFFCQPEKITSPPILFVLSRTSSRCIYFSNVWSQSKVTTVHKNQPLTCFHYRRPQTTESYATRRTQQLSAGVTEQHAFVLFFFINTFTFQLNS